MSDTFNPGDGWRVMTSPPQDQDTPELRFWNGENWTFWVRVPPLPTEPYTVIETTRKGTEEKRRWFLSEGDSWWWIGTTTVRLSGDLAREITGFEVLSEPRAVTAKAVLGKAHAYVFQALGEDVPFDHIAREFGVES